MLVVDEAEMTARHAVMLHPGTLRRLMVVFQEVGLTVLCDRNYM